MDEEVLVWQQTNHFVFHLVVEVDVLLFYLKFLHVFGHFLKKSADDLVAVVVFD